MTTPTTTTHDDDVDHAMVEQIVSGRPRTRKPTHAECVAAYQRLRRLGKSTFEIERDYGLKSDRYAGADL